MKPADTPKLPVGDCSCGQRKYPEDSWVWLCDPCLAEALKALRSGEESGRFQLFSSEDEELLCRHADEDTLLITDDPDHEDEGYCEQCLLESAEQRGLTLN